jgi:hypothetical protein
MATVSDERLVEGMTDMGADTSRMTIRVYAVDRSGRITREAPPVHVSTNEPPPVLGSPLNWPPCQCARATGLPCPEQGRR